MGNKRKKVENRCIRRKYNMDSHTAVSGQISLMYEEAKTEAEKTKNQLEITETQLEQTVIYLQLAKQKSKRWFLVGLWTGLSAGATATLTIILVILQ